MAIINQIVKGGGTTPTGTMYIISNGTYNVTDKAIANVQVPTTAPAHYIEKAVDANGKLIGGSTVISFNGVTDIGNYALMRAYSNNTNITGVIDMSDLTTVSGGYACNYTFYGCTGLTSADLSSLTTVSGDRACQDMFASCTGLTSVVLSSLTTISGSMFACDSMFGSCAGLITVSLPALTTVSGGSGCSSMFTNCTGLTSASLPALTTATARNAFGNMFQNCTSLATVYIGGTTAIDFGSNTNQFNNMFQGCTQNIDVYAPAASQSTIEAFSGYPKFGGTGTVTWHWRS